MEITSKNRRNIKIQNIIFLCLLLTAMTLIAWLSQKYQFQSDWTANQRNTLSTASIELLKKIDSEITITAFTRDSNVSQYKTLIEDLVSKYQKHHKKIKLNFINPELDPATTRELNIRAEGEMIISITGRSEHLLSIKEQDLTNVLQRLIRSVNHSIFFLTGHGERIPEGKANHDYQLFNKSLKDKGIHVQLLNLSEKHAIPDNTSTLVIAGPRVNYLPGEVKLIQAFIAKGGNLLWLQEPGDLLNLLPLAEQLNLQFIKGVLVDTTTQMLGIPATSALAESYASHSISDEFKFGTLFPHSGGLKLIDENNDDFIFTPLIKTTKKSWLETGTLQGEVAFNLGVDTLGPITLAFALERTLSTDKKQRIVVISDSDFISNQFLGNLGNKEMGLRLFNWLSNDDNLITIPSSTSPDTQLILNNTSWAVIGLFFLIGLPIILISSGFIIWRKRRNR